MASGYYNPLWTVLVTLTIWLYSCKTNTTFHNKLNQIQCCYNTLLLHHPLTDNFASCLSRQHNQLTSQAGLWMTNSNNWASSCVCVLCLNYAREVNHIYPAQAVPMITVQVVGSKYWTPISDHLYWMGILRQNSPQDDSRWYWGCYNLLIEIISLNPLLCRHCINAWIIVQRLGQIEKGFIIF